MQSQLEQLEYRFKSRLNQLPPREVRTGRDLIRRMLPEIEAALAKGYSLFDLHLVLADDGLPFSFETFRRYYREEKAAAAYHASQHPSNLGHSIEEQEQDQPSPAQVLSSQQPIAHPTIELTTSQSISDPVSEEALSNPTTISTTESIPVSASVQQKDSGQPATPRKQNSSRAQPTKSTTKPQTKSHKLSSSNSANATATNGQNLPLSTSESAPIEERAQPPPEQIAQSQKDVPFPEIQLGTTWIDQSKYFNKY